MSAVGDARKRLERQTAENDAVLAGQMETWPAFQREVDTQWLDTDIVRRGWPLPTCYREHETIHVLCNVIDNLRRELAETRVASPEADLCHEFIETGDCDHSDAEHDAMQTRAIPPGQDSAS